MLSTSAARFAVFGAALLLGSCSRKSDDSGASGVDAGAFDKGALLRAFGECAIGGYREFQTAAASLDAATRAASASPDAATLEGARAAWKNAIDAWQRAEVFAFGPAAMTGQPGGKDLRDPIYAWPLVNRCLTEQQIVDQSYAGPAFATALVSTRGLGTAEYLLFYEAFDNGCAETAPINAAGTWAALGEAEIKKRRLAYAQAASADVVVRAQQLVDAWDPAKGNFLGELANAGQSKVFASQQMAFNAVNGALFYADSELKDLKVGKPAGLVEGCVAVPCVQDVESPWAKRSKEHIRNNLRGLDRMVRGCGANGEGLAFDDLLHAVGADGVAASLQTTLDASVVALDALREPTLEDDLVKDPAGVKRFYDAVRAFGVVLKTDFVTVLDFELPKRVEGDND